MDHSFNIKIAEKFGVNIAIIVNNFDFWLSKNKANGKNFKDNKYWTYNSVKAFNQLFPYFTERQINHALKKMEDLQIIETGVYNINSYDRTKWYTFHNEFIYNYKPILQFCQIEEPKMSKGYNEDVKSLYTDINTDINTDIETKKSVYYSNDYFSINNDIHLKYKSLYVNTDIDYEYKQMEMWLISNPKKLKTNYSRFITNWLSRQEKDEREKLKTKTKSIYKELTCQHQYNEDGICIKCGEKQLQEDTQ